MKIIISTAILILFVISASAQTENKEAIQKSKELIAYLRSTPLSRATKTKAEQYTFKFYDTVIYQFFDTSAMSKILAKDTEKLSPEGKIDLERLYLWQLHLYVLVSNNIEVNVEKNKEEPSLLQVTLKDKMSKHSSPDFYISINPVTNGILTIDASMLAFEGKVDKVKQLTAKQYQEK